MVFLIFGPHGCWRLFFEDKISEKMSKLVHFMFYLAKSGFLCTPILKARVSCLKILKLTIGWPRNRCRDNYLSVFSCKFSISKSLSSLSILIMADSTWQLQMPKTRSRKKMKSKTDFWKIHPAFFEIAITGSWAASISGKLIHQFLWVFSFCKISGYVSWARPISGKLVHIWMSFP